MNLRLFVFAALSMAVCPWVADRGLWAADTDAAKKTTKPSGGKAAASRDIEFFEKHIRPVLVKHCYECHSAKAAKAKKLRGGLLLDTRQGIRKGGDSGPAVVPGKPGQSVILSALKHEDYEMPPDGKLPKRVIAKFETWIKRGAADPRDGKANKLPANDAGIDFEQARQFWAFQPLVKRKPPDVPGSAKDLSPIDRFIRATLAEDGLPSAPPADKRTLIRRLYFDLIGLPPTPDEIQRVLNDDSPDAIAKLVDRLLASKHFGERWGRHWLDVARYAESSGGGRTLVYKIAWRYRDYVIRSFNRDKPYNEFVREQIAGDLLPWKTIADRRDNLTGTGFLMLGPTNYELQDKELLRMEVVDEQLDTMGRAFLGMTIGCARCHDHKFDPIPNEDYYALAGIFRSTHILTPGNVSGYLKRSLPVDEEHARRLAAYEKKVNPLQDEIGELKERLKRLRRNRSGVTTQRVARAKLPGLVRDDDQAKLSGDWNTSSSVKPFVENGYRYSGNQNAKAVFSLPIKQSGTYEVRISYSANPNRAAMAAVTIHHAEGEVTKRIDQRKRPPVNGLFKSLGRFRFKKGKDARVEFTSRAAHGIVIIDAVQLLSEEDRKQLAKKKKQSGTDDKLEAKITAASKRLKSLEAELNELKKAAPPPAPKVMAAAEHKDAGDYHICIRGNVHKLGEEVPRGFLRVLWDGPPPKIPEGSSGRLQLADWLVSDANPLTPRVYVNRVWHHLFGSGIVRTVDNFGTMGERPSHPELLDWLAVTFKEDGWSTKQLIRRIVLSKTYQQSASTASTAPGADASGSPAVDPENRLLSHQNRRRMDAECIRDCLLAVSGQLDRSIGGPSMDEKVNSEFGYKHRSLRRSVYVPAFRNTIHPLLQVFNVADPNLVTGRRTPSTLPTQALYLMNSPFVMEQSRHAAVRLLQEDLPDDETRLNVAYTWCLGRSPSPRERELALSYLQTMIDLDDTDSRQQAWATLFQTLFASIDFRYVE